MTPTILVVDGDRSACETACQTLRDAGFECIWANTGEHALALLTERSEVPNLFVFDLHLADMPGPTLAWLLSERYGELPVLFVSDSSFDAGLVRAARGDFLAKPFTAESLVAAVRRLLSEPDARSRSAS